MHLSSLIAEHICLGMLNMGTDADCLGLIYNSLHLALYKLVTFI